MKNYTNRPDGYRESIERGLSAARGFSGLTYGTGTLTERVSALKEALLRAEAIVIGAGAGLSTSAGFTYSGERFRRSFFDFEEKFGIQDMYSGGFYPFPDDETRWAWWARHIYFNRYVDAPKPVYDDLFRLVKGKDYFVITTNVDHLFQRSGFDKKRLFYTQGDYGLFQSVDRRNQSTCDNEEWVMRAMAAQGFIMGDDGVFHVPENGALSMRIPTELIPKHPLDGSHVVMNLRADDSFLEDEGWRRASAAYSDFLRSRAGSRILFLELGVGSNTPVIIKYPFWQMTAENESAIYACVNRGEAYAPVEIMSRSICADGDIGEIIKLLLS